MPRYTFEIDLPIAIPEDVLKTELQRFVRDLLKKYGKYKVEITVRPEEEVGGGEEVGEEEIGL